ncbi:unnamed protein product [Prunus armeniaca]
MSNPRGREDCNVVRTLRCRKSYDNRENSIENEQLAVKDNAEKFVAVEPAKTVEKHNLADPETVTKQVLQRVYDPPLPYPERVIPKARDQKLKDFMQTLSKVDNLYLSADFVVLDMHEDLQTPIILGRPFMVTARTLIAMKAGTLTLRVHDQYVVFNLFEAAKRLAKQQE